MISEDNWRSVSGDESFFGHPAWTQMHLQRNAAEEMSCKQLL